MRRQKQSLESLAHKEKEVDTTYQEAPQRFYSMDFIECIRCPAALFVGFLISAAMNSEISFTTVPSVEEEFYHELLVDRLGAKQGKLRSDFTVIPEVASTEVGPKESLLPNEVMPNKVMPSCVLDMMHDVMPKQAGPQELAILGAKEASTGSHQSAWADLLNPDEAEYAIKDMMHVMPKQAAPQELAMLGAKEASTGQW